MSSGGLKIVIDVPKGIQGGLLFSQPRCGGSKVFRVSEPPKSAPRAARGAQEGPRIAPGGLPRRLGERLFRMFLEFFLFFFELRFGFEKKIQKNL